MDVAVGKLDSGAVGRSALIPVSAFENALVKISVVPAYH